MNRILSFLSLCILLAGCSVSDNTNKSQPAAAQFAAAAPQIQKGESWVYRRGNQATFTRRGLVWPKQIEFPLRVGKVWNFELWLGNFWTTVDMRAEVLNFKPVAVPAGTFDAFEIRYECSSRGPFRQPSCGSWTRWYAPEVGNLIAQQAWGSDTQLSWELIKFKRIRPTAPDSLSQQTNAILP